MYILGTTYDMAVFSEELCHASRIKLSLTSKITRSIIIMSQNLQLFTYVFLIGSLLEFCWLFDFLDARMNFFHIRVIKTKNFKPS